MNTLPYSLRIGLVALMLAPITALIALAAVPVAQPGTVLTLPPESPRWELEANAKPAEFLGRKCLMLNGGAALVRDFELRDGVVDVDVATPAERGFFRLPVPPAGRGRQWRDPLPAPAQVRPARRHAVHPHPGHRAELGSCTAGRASPAR